MVGSDLDLNLDEFTGRGDLTATRRLEIMVGADRIVRINVDGQCALRVWMTEDCQFNMRNDFARPAMPVDKE